MRQTKTNIGGTTSVVTPPRACHHAYAESNDICPGQNAATSNAKPAIAISHGTVADSTALRSDESAFIAQSARAAAASAWTSASRSFGACASTPSSGASMRARSVSRFS